MSIRFVCPNCGKKLKSADDTAGRKVACRGCGVMLVIPGTPVPQHVYRSIHDEEPGEPPLLAPRHKVEEELVDMTAMVDVTFFLLIFFLVTSMQALQTAIDMPKPNSQKAGSGHVTMQQYEQDQDYIIVRIDRDDTVWIEDAEAPSRQEVLARLHELVGERDEASKKMLVVANGEARHGTVVMVLDAAAEHRIADVRLTTEDDG